MKSDETDPNHRYGFVFRVDGSARIGTGHVMRCLTLANALRERQFSTIFLSRNLSPELEQLLRIFGHEVTILNQGGPKPPQSADLYSAWLGTSEAFDASCVCKELKNRPTAKLSAMIVDHYSLGAEWETLVASELKLPIFAIDDLGRNHTADTILDTTFGKDPQEYSGLVPANANVLVGSEFALLRPEFVQQRPRSLRRRQSRARSEEPPRSLLIALGGGDQDDALGFLLPAILEIAPELGLKIHALVGPVYPHLENLMSLCRRHAESLEVHYNIKNVAEVIASIDVCIGAAGSSTWERCCLGIPTLNIVIADNQQTVDQNLSQSGIAVSGGKFARARDGTASIGQQTAKTWVNKTLLPFLRDISQLEQLSENSAAIADGGGSIRALKTLLTYVPNKLEVQLRPAGPPDAEILYEWQSFPGTRRHFRSSVVPEWSDHLRWYENRLRSMPDKTWIVLYGNIPAGFVRLDETAEVPDAVFGHKNEEVSILVAPELQGRGIAGRALRDLIDIHTGQKIFAHVLPENTASMRLFTKCGFEAIGNNMFVHTKTPQNSSMVLDD